ncbi:MAG: hypothetical protein HC896_03515 [Bacteroidales bacterium]|nr:hypothetical protein [Bacteroidales bacterium]
MKTQIVTIGNLAKEETLSTIDHKIVQNTLVLESEAPFPGYHGANLPSETKPGMIFLLRPLDILSKRWHVSHPISISFSRTASMHAWAAFAFTTTAIAAFE